MLSKLNLRIKSMIAPSAALLLMVLVGVMSHIAKSELDETLNRVTKDLAPDSGIAADLLANLLEKRLVMKDFLKSGSAEDVAKFNALHDQYKTIMEKAESSIQDPQRIEMLSKTAELSEQYADTFSGVVVANMDERNRLVNQVLDDKGPKMRKALSDIMSTAFADNDATAAYYAGTVQEHLMLARLYAYRFLVDNEMEAADRVNKEIDVAQQQLEKLLSELQNPQRREWANFVGEQMQQYREAFAETVVVINKRNSAVANTLDVIGPEMALLSEELKESVFDSLDQVGEKAHEGILASQQRNIILIVLAFVLGIFAAQYIVHSIVKVVHQTQAMSKQLSEGILTARVNVNTKDELGQMATGFNEFANFLHGTITDVNQQTNHVRNASDDLLEIAENIGSQIEQQAKETELAATAMLEMNASSEEVSRNAEQASTAAQDAHLEMQNGSAVIRETSSTINRMAEIVEDTVTTIDKLNTDSDNIYSILDVIKGVAEQTNLLALNAAIEAARAGEQGRGFAVVADEVRTLAQRTQESTSEIEVVVESLQTAARESASAMTQTQEIAKRTVDQTQKTDESLQAIENAITKILDMNTQIAAASSEQLSVSEEISRNINHIQSLADDTSKGSKQVFNSGEKLSHTVHALQSHISKFAL